MKILHEQPPNTNPEVKTIYLAGPYTGTIDEIKINIDRAIIAARLLTNKGYTVFCPHTNLSFLKSIENTKEGRSLIMQNCFVWVKLCEYFAIMPEWSESKGSIEELSLAIQLNKKIIYLTYN